MSQPPTLLTLPAEIRLEILHYALFFPCQNHSLPNTISVFWPRAFKDSDKNKPSFYGTESMSNFFVVSRQLHIELEEILFTRFIFSFPHYAWLTSVKDFITTISPRARTLLREVMVGIRLNLGFDETEAFRRSHNKNMLKPAHEALEYLKAVLPGLHKVHLNVRFVSGPLSGVLVKGRVDEFADMVMGLVTIFTLGIEVVIANEDHQQCRKDITKECQERLADLMANSKPQEDHRLQDGMATLQFS